MTAHVTITIDARSAYEARSEMRKLLGAATPDELEDAANSPARAPDPEQSVGGISREPVAWGFQHVPVEAASAAPVSPTTGVLDEIAKTVAAIPVRERGKPAPGRARRTKDEIAEDEAADKADAVRAQAATEAGIQAESADDVKSAISTGDERVGPEDSPEDAAQDAADEAAETAADKTGLTLDDLRKAAGEYQKKFGMAAAVADIPGIIGGPIVEVPAEGLSDAIAKIEAAIQGKGAVEAKLATPTPEPTAPTKDQLVAALKRYAKKFDGQDTDMNAMPATMEDGAKIFTLLFGEGVTKLSQVPADGYGRAIAGIDEAIQKNPFKR